MLENFLTPPSLNDYSDYFKTLLSISGVLLGLIFTALLFVIQSGFSSFKFSRRMFLEQYVVFGNNLLTTLSYLTLMPLGALYLGSQRIFLSGIYIAFALIFTKTFLDVYKQRGYIHTLFSTASVPAHYGKFRSYFRYIRNLGLHYVLFMVLWLAMLWVYPIVISYYESRRVVLTTKGLFYSTLILLAYSVIQITYFIPHFFKLSNLELEQKISTTNDTPNGESSNIDFLKEKAVLRTYLSDHGVQELGSEVGFLDGHLSLNFLDDRNTREAWFNVNIEVNNNGVYEVRDAVLDYAYNFFKLLDNTLIDINSFVLSFHIKMGGDEFRRNVFLRITRPELKEVLSATKNPRLAVLNVKNKLLDELFRDLD